MSTYKNIISNIVLENPNYENELSMLIAGVIGSLEEECSEENILRANYLAKEIMDVAATLPFGNRTFLLNLATRLNEYIEAASIK